MFEVTIEITNQDRLTSRVRPVVTAGDEFEAEGIAFNAFMAANPTAWASVIDVRSVAHLFA